jgi:uncharacterized protein (DUF1697 family)
MFPRHRRHHGVGVGSVRSIDRPTTTRWIALLRGINVGGGNRLPMADLRVTMIELGFERVTTYIQSGNIVFDAADADEQRLAERLAAAIAERHGMSVPVVLRTAAEIGRIAVRHPEIGGGLDPKFLHVHFLDATPQSVASLDPSAHAPDGWVVDGREVYVHYPNGSRRSRLTIDVFERAFGVTATARNLNTVRKLVELADAGRSARKPG